MKQSKYVISTIFVAARHSCVGVINCSEKETTVITNFKTDWKETMYYYW